MPAGFGGPGLGGGAANMSRRGSGIIEKSVRRRKDFSRQSGDISRIACVGDGTPGGSISNMMQFAGTPFPGDNGQTPMYAGSKTPMYGSGAEMNVLYGRWWQNTWLAHSAYDN
ncbi:hypothetical protein TELCIR_06517 [Teladorsagia circumcincta]|uniref:Uncharacterized protein n=1 Tax=Teladorsagia circumcincta TaxID=45464 RepID=A0A2G9UMS3_TELCI|nr:hypothetical protein TELCIR_06517 [Teladorsagia circumcincta]